MRCRAVPEPCAQTQTAATRAAVRRVSEVPGGLLLHRRGKSRRELVGIALDDRGEAGRGAGLGVRQDRAEIEQAIDVDNAAGSVRVGVKVSVGVAVFPDDGESMSELIRIADQRMYANKSERKSGGPSFLERLV